MTPKRAAEKSPEVDAYLARPREWPKENARLRAILLECGLGETFKWGKPCYEHGGDNVVILQEFKDFVALLFFKGALLKDPQRVLESQGENTRSALRVTFRSVAEVRAKEAALRALVREAIDVQKAGLTIPKSTKLVLAPELRSRLDADAKLAAAFDALTPGRRREYNLFISGAKKTETRSARVDKCVPLIRAGKGLRD